MKKKRAMDEQSQIDAMRAAVRGDLERARSRRGSTLLQPDRAPDPEPEHLPDPAPEAEPESALSEAAEAEPVVEEPEHQPVAVEEPEPEPAPEPPAVEEAPQPKRGFRFWRR